jgi:hypothetical protein
MKTALVTMGGFFDGNLLAQSLPTDVALRVAWRALQNKLAADPSLGSDLWLNHVRAFA